MIPRRSRGRAGRILCVLAALLLCVACGRKARPQPLYGETDPAITTASR